MVECLLKHLSQRTYRGPTVMLHSKPAVLLNERFLLLHSGFVQLLQQILIDPTERMTVLSVRVGLGGYERNDGAIRIHLLLSCFVQLPQSNAAHRRFPDARCPDDEDDVGVIMWRQHWQHRVDDLGELLVPDPNLVERFLSLQLLSVKGTRPWPF